MIFINLVIFLWSFLCGGVSGSQETNCRTESRTNSLKCQYIRWPKYIPRNTRLLEIHRSNLHALEKDRLKSYQQLEEVNFSKNQIEELSIEAFAGQERLRRLTLANNQLKYINDKALVYLQDLQLLDLSHNQLMLLTKKNFAKLTSLKQLNLGGNEIECFHKNALHGLENLEKLQLSLGRFKLHDNLLLGMDLLRELNISEMANVRQIPENIFQNKNRLNSLMLKLLNLSNGGLPINLLQGCPHLQKLSIINCSLTKIPTLMLTTAQQLNYLDLSENNLQNGVQKSDFEGLSQLRVLILRRCNLTVIGDGTFNISTLMKIDLTSNQLTTLKRSNFYVNKSNPISMVLSANPWKCDCLLKWLLQVKIVNTTNRISTCTNGDFNRKPLVDVIKEEKKQLPCKVTIPKVQLTQARKKEYILESDIRTVINDTIKCIGNGYPQPNISWFVRYWNVADDMNLYPKYSTCMKVTATNTDQSSIGGVQARQRYDDLLYDGNNTLTIYNLPTSVCKAQYTCLVKNNHSCAQKTITIKRYTNRCNATNSFILDTNNTSNMLSLSQRNSVQRWQRDDVDSEQDLCKLGPCLSLCSCDGLVAAMPLEVRSSSNRARHFGLLLLVLTHNAVFYLFL